MKQQKDALAQKRTKDNEQRRRWKRYCISGRNQFPRFCLVLRFGLSSIWAGKEVLMIWSRSLDKHDDFVGHMIMCNGSMTHLPPERSLGCSLSLYLNLYCVSLLKHCVCLDLKSNKLIMTIITCGSRVLTLLVLFLAVLGLSHPSSSSLHQFVFDLQLHARV